MQGVCDTEDERGSSGGRESQTDENSLSWIKAITLAASRWEAEQMEEKIERTSRPQIGARPMNYSDVLNTANMTISQRGKEYGDISTSFMRASVIASATLNKTITPYDVAMILHSVKLSRIANNPTIEDSWVDLAAYGAIAANLASTPRMPQVGDTFLADVESKLNEARIDAPA
jgi:hypothetical protein